MRTRAVTIAALFALPLAFVACSAADTPEGDDPTASVEATDPQAAEASAGPREASTEAAPGATSLTGDADGTTDEVDLTPGVYRVEYTHAGPGPITVQAVAAAGPRSSLIDGGRERGAVALVVSAPGRHTFDVKAQGEWTLLVAPIGADPARSLPIEVTSAASDVSEPFTVSREVTAVARLMGRGRLELRFLRLDGPASPTEPQVVTEPGDTKVRPLLEPGVYVLEIRSQGDARYEVELTSGG